MRVNSLADRITPLLQGRGPLEALSPADLARRVSAPYDDVRAALRAMEDTGDAVSCPDGWGWYGPRRFAR
jgi:hypothetical protein